MPGEDSFRQVVSVFQQISDCTRLRILWLLCHATASVGAIARSVGMSDSAVSHHLRVLRQDGLVSAKRSGKEVYYRLAASEKAQLLHRTIDAMFEIECPGGEEQ